MGHDRPDLLRDDGDQEGGVTMGRQGSRGRADFRLSAAVGEYRSPRYYDTMGRTGQAAGRASMALRSWQLFPRGGTVGGMNEKYFRR